VLVLSLALASGVVGAGESVAATPTQGGRMSAGALRFHDDMRKLWEDHITWTRLTIVSFAASQPDLAPTLHRLLQNQQDIGDAVKPYYGDQAGDRLAELLRRHILGSVDILTAAKAGDTAKEQEAIAAWYANADQIAEFLHAANPHHWPLHETRAMMHEHLDLTLKEAADRLKGDFAADIADYDRVHIQILGMADFLSDGIMDQFPARFH
jgi:hypothetical protein